MHWAHQQWKYSRILRKSISTEASILSVQKYDRQSIYKTSAVYPAFLISDPCPNNKFHHSTGLFYKAQIQYQFFSDPSSLICCEIIRLSSIRIILSGNGEELIFFSEQGAISNIDKQDCVCTWLNKKLCETCGCKGKSFGKSVWM